MAQKRFGSDPFTEPSHTWPKGPKVQGFYTCWGASFSLVQFH